MLCSLQSNVLCYSFELAIGLRQLRHAHAICILICCGLISGRKNKAAVCLCFHWTSRGGTPQHHCKHEAPPPGTLLVVRSGDPCQYSEPFGRETALAAGRLFPAAPQSLLKFTVTVCRHVAQVYSYEEETAFCIVTMTLGQLTSAIALSAKFAKECK